MHFLPKFNWNMLLNKKSNEHGFVRKWIFLVLVFEFSPSKLSWTKIKGSEAYNAPSHELEAMVILVVVYDSRQISFPWKIGARPGPFLFASGPFICFCSQIFPFAYCVECNRSLGSFSRYNRSWVAKQEFYFLTYFSLNGVGI